jgi:ParB-like chromosome segregation protein Spo0J
MSEAAEAEVPWAADNVERRPVASLIAYARNARTHNDDQVEQIVASIRQFGWTIPVLVDEEGVLIAGHGRIMAAQRIGLVDVPTMVARGWSERQKQAYRIADNKLALNSGWDTQLLAQELALLAQDDDGMAKLTGFGEDELKKLLAKLGPPDEFASYDETIQTEHECPKCGYRFSGGTKRTVEQRTTLDNVVLEEGSDGDAE